MIAYEVISVGPVRVVRKPVCFPPPEGEPCFAEMLVEGRRARGSPARFANGSWQNLSGRPLAWEPTHWAIMEAGNGEV